MSDFSELTVIGNVTADLELKRGDKSGKDYLCFSLANNKGSREEQRTSFYNCWLFGDDCRRMIDAKVKKGSCLIVVGELEMSPYEKKDGSKKISPKLTVHNWQYAPGGVKKTDSDSNAPASSSISSFPDDLPGEIDCGDDGLPL